ncbi:MAG: hypothetical protein ACI837_001788 [Crocinitomicaceae bacterium]|jgi:hypothetical protein
MKKLLVFSVVLIGLFSCKFMKEEIKKSIEITKSANKVCDCNNVSVSTLNSNGVTTLTVEIEGTTATNLNAKSKEIYAQLEMDFEELCTYDFIKISFKDGGVSEFFTFDGCEADLMNEPAEDTEA